MSAEAAQEGLEHAVEREVRLEVQKELKAKEEALEHRVALAVEAAVKEDVASMEKLSSQERMSRAGEAVMEGTWPVPRETAVLVVLSLLIGTVGRLLWLLREKEPAPSAQPAAAETAGGVAVPAEVEHTARIPAGVPTACAACLALVPLGVFAQPLGLSATATFWVNLLAIVPESFIICVATEELALHLGDSAGALLNASFGNAVELTFVFLTLREGMLDACAGAIVGSILSNQLVLLGFAFLLAGTLMEPERARVLRSAAADFAAGRTAVVQVDNKGGMHYDSARALEQGLQLLVASFSVSLPSTFARMQSLTGPHVLTLSRSFSVILLFSYVAVLIGQLKGSRGNHEQETHRATLSACDALALLAAATAAVSLSSKCLVDALQEFCTGLGLSYGFVGMVLLPVAGDFSHVSAVYLAMKGKMDLAINISLASATQNALVIAPFAVVMGVFIGQPMSLGLQPIYGVVLLISAAITFAVIVDGRSSWIRGYILLTTYALVCLVIFFAPDVASPGRMQAVPA